MSFKVATWNVNSLRVRLPHVLAWLQQHDPDVLVLQETKIQDQYFPVGAFQELGYQAVFAGQKTYNGVATISKQVAQDVLTDPAELNDPARRVLAATINGVRIINLYVPNGASLASEKYQYKLDWLNKISAHVQQVLQQYPYVIVLGDFNIAPSDHDVHDPHAWQNCVLVSPAERSALQTLLAHGLYDTFRHFTQPDHSYSWWDYRQAAFRRNRGLRIDLILTSNQLLPFCLSCEIDKLPRGLEQPSDHAPVICDYKLDRGA